MLKAITLKEFSVHVHEELWNRKKKAEESFKDYLFRAVVASTDISTDNK